MPNDEQITQLTIELGSKEHVANAAAVSDTMAAVEAAIDQIHQEVDSNRQLLVKARPFAKGSFEIPLELIVFATGGLLQQPDLINLILDVLKEFFSIKKRLAGRSFTVKGDNTIIIQNSEVIVHKTTVNILNPASIPSQKFAKAFETIEKDESIKDVTIRSDKQDGLLAEVSRAEFGHFKTVAGSDPTKGPTEKVSREILHIHSTVFEGKSKWSFVRNGRPIWASIDDKEFAGRVAAGIEEFAAGDTLEVDLKTWAEYDIMLDCYMDRRHGVVRVVRHIKRPKDTGLFGKETPQDGRRQSGDARINPHSQDEK